MPMKGHINGIGGELIANMFPEKFKGMTLFAVAMKAEERLRAMAKPQVADPGVFKNNCFSFCHQKENIFLKIACLFQI